MKILLFGGFGLLGQDIFKVLIDLDIEVIRFSSDELNLLDFDKLETKVSEICPDIVINAAGYTDVIRSEKELSLAFQGNVITTHNLVKCLRPRNIPLVHFSTDYIFSGKQTTPYTEQDFTDPINNYGWSKLISEQIITTTLKKYYIIRTSWLFGTGGKCFPKSILSQLKNAKELSVVADQIGSPTFSYDLAKMVPVIVNGPFGIYHFANKGVVSWLDFSKVIAEMSGNKHLVQFIRPISGQDQFVKRPSYSVLDTSKVQKTFNLDIRDFREALKDYLEYLN